MRRYRSGMQWAIWRHTRIGYIDRFHLIKTPWFSIFLHWINYPDPEPHPHDHPVTFLSVILRGSYWEARGLSPSRRLHHRRWFNLVRASTIHQIVAVVPRTLTLCFAGPPVHEWGFWTPAGKVPWTRYEQNGIVRKVP